MGDTAEVDMHTSAVALLPFFALCVRKPTLCGWVLGVCLLAPSIADGNPITLTATGTLDYTCEQCLKDTLGIAASPGDPFSFSWTFEPRVWTVTPPAGRFGLSLGSHRIVLTSFTNIFVLDGTGERGFADAFTIAASLQQGETRAFAYFSGSDESGQWLDSVELPADIGQTLRAAPTLGFSIAHWASEETLASGTPLTMTIRQSPTPAPVPEPATLTLLAVGLAGLGARRWSQRKER